VEVPVKKCAADGLRRLPVLVGGSLWKRNGLRRQIGNVLLVRPDLVALVAAVELDDRLARRVIQQSSGVLAGGAKTMRHRGRF